MALVGGTERPATRPRQRRTVRRGPSRTGRSNAQHTIEAAGHGTGTRSRRGRARGVGVRRRARRLRDRLGGAGLRPHRRRHVRRAGAPGPRRRARPGRHLGPRPRDAHPVDHRRSRRDPAGRRGRSPAWPARRGERRGRRARPPARRRHDRADLPRLLPGRRHQQPLHARERPRGAALWARGSRARASTSPSSTPACRRCPGLAASCTAPTCRSTARTPSRQPRQLRPRHPHGRDHRRPRRRADARPRAATAPTSSGSPPTRGS